MMTVGLPIPKPRPIAFAEATICETSWSAPEAQWVGESHYFTGPIRHTIKAIDNRGHVIENLPGFCGAEKAMRAGKRIRITVEVIE